MLRIVLAQQETLLRGALATVLAVEQDFEVVAEASNQEELLVAVTRQAPALVVAHHALPGTRKIRDLCVELQEIKPDLGMLVVADRSAAADLTELVTGAQARLGLVAIDSPPAALVDGVRRIDAGQPVFDVVLAVSVLGAVNNPLTKRERAVLRQALGGAPVRDIAADLFLSAGTVRNYLSRAVSKTGARTRIEAIRIAYDAGWI